MRNDVRAHLEDLTITIKMTSKTKPLLSFDLDQTLIETREAHWRAWKLALEKYKLKAPARKKLIALLDGRHASEVARALFPKLNKEKIEMLRLAHRYYVMKTAKYAKPIKKANKILELLGKKYILAIISNNTHKEIHVLLKATRIPKRLFSFFVGHGDVRCTKPCPDVILKAENLAKRKTDIHIGDSPYDILAARRAGAKAIAVLTGVNSRSKLARYKPWKIIKSVAELPKVLK